MSLLTSPSKAEKALGSISKYFNLGRVSSFKRAGGDSNYNYYITTDLGDYVFKIIIEHTFHDVKSDIIYLERLKKHGFPASYYIEAPSGSSIYNQNDLMAVAMQMLPGKEPKPEREINRAIGHNLARLHLIPPHSLPTKKCWLSKGYLTKAIKILQKNVDGEKLKGTISEYKKIKNFDFSLFPQGVIHSDVAPENCLFVGKKLSAIVDWEGITISALFVDFAMTALKYCFTNNGFQPELYKSLKQGYCEARPFSNKENRHLEEAIKYAGLTVSVWRNLHYNLYYPNEEKKERYKSYWEKWGIHTWKLPSGL